MKESAAAVPDNVALGSVQLLVAFAWTIVNVRG